MLLKILQYARQPCPTKKYPDQKVHSAKVEKPAAEQVNASYLCCTLGF